MRNFFLLFLVSQMAMPATIKDYGAVGNGSTDDTAAIQNAINATKSGTLTFPDGTYKLSHSLQLLPGVTYQGVGSAKLQGNGSFFILQSPQSDPAGLAITGLTLDDGGLQLNAAPNDPNAGVTITGNTFQNLTSNNGSGNWTLGNFIFAGLMRYTKVQNNTFRNALINSSTRPDGTGNSIAWVNGAIMVYGLDQSSIDHNTFDHIGEAIKICFSQPYQAHNAYIGYNLFTGVHRMALESQGAVGCGGKWPPPTGSTAAIVGFTIENNRIVNPLDPYWETYGLSLATPTPAGAQDLTIRNNYIQGGVPDYWNSQHAGGNYGYGIEAGGANMQVVGNTISGVYSPQAITISASSSGTVANNVTCAAQPGAKMTIGAETGPSPAITYANNTTLAICPVPLADPTAGQNIGATGTPSIPVPPVAPSQPPVQPPVQAGPIKAGTYVIGDGLTLALDAGFLHWQQKKNIEEYAEATVANPYQQWALVAHGSHWYITNVGVAASDKKYKPYLSDSTGVASGPATLQIGMRDDTWTITPSGAGYTIQNTRTKNYIGPDPAASEGVVGMSKTPAMWSIHLPK